MSTSTGINILYQARFWSYVFKGNVVCEVRKDGRKVTSHLKKGFVGR